MISQEERDFIDPQGAQIRKAAEESALVLGELTDLNPNIEMDAKEFGEHVRNGGWRLGLLVARSVSDDYGIGEKPWEDEGISKATWYRRYGAKKYSSEKISFRGFCRQVGDISPGTVRKYLDGWNMAARDGLVPPSDNLSPGEVFEFDVNTHTPKVWDNYFKPRIKETRPRDDIPAWVYRAFDSAGNLLYIGSTEDPKVRTSKHSRESDWYPLAVSWKWEMYLQVSNALSAESEAIKTEKPVFNIQWRTLDT